MMPSPAPRSTVRVAGVPLHAMLAPLTAVCLMQTLVTDVVYWKTAAIMWADMSAWLLTAGLLIGLLAVITGLIDFFADRRIRALPSAWLYGLSSAVALVLSIFNIFIHSRDAYTSVVPTGLLLSTLVVLVLLVSAWSGWDMVYRHGVGVRLEDRP